MSKPEPTISDVLEVISDLSEAMAAGFDDLRTELKDDINELRAELKGDISNLQQDVSVLKEDVSTLKQDVSVLKKDVHQLKLDMAEVKAIVKGHEDDIREIYRILTRIEAGMKISDADKLATKERLERLIAWAQEVSKQIDVSLTID